MPDSLPDGIQRSHLLEAITRFDAEEPHQFADSTAYDVLHGGKRYPPKALVGIAAGVLTGSVFYPADFKGGQASKCFRVLQKNGFSIVPKTGVQPENVWIFQGNPARFDIDDYLGRYSYIYWRAPRHRAEIRVGDQCLIWRSGDAAGAIAVGRIAEAPQPMSDVNFPECLGEDLWTDEPDSADTVKVGIALDDVRLDEAAGFVPRAAFTSNPILSQSTIIRTPQGTVFKLAREEANEAFSLWNTPLDLPAEALPVAMEGGQRLRQHYARERSRTLVKKKREQFAQAHGGRFYCEVCRFDFSERYPPDLGDGFIEVHHLAPLFLHDQPRRTSLDDLLLVCSNCHRMIHRTKDAEANLRRLHEHFAVQDEPVK